MGKYLIVGHPDGIFRSADMGKTWNLVHSTGGNVFKVVNDKTLNSDSVRVVNGPNTSSDDKRKVFQIYAFGKVLYAVLIIDIDAPPQPILNFSEENGYLKLSWAPVLQKMYFT